MDSQEDKESTIAIEERPKERKRIEIPTLEQEKTAFHERVVGQEEAVEEFAILYRILLSGIRSSEKGPIDIKYLAGPSGVGKTEIVYTLASLIGKAEEASEEKVIKLNGGDYQSDASISKVLGAPPGYLGSEDVRYPGGTRPIFSQENLDENRIFYTDVNGQKRSVTIILIDEAEKAHIALHRALLSVLDKGQMELGNNKSTDFSDTVIFYTSNVGNERVEDMEERDQNMGSEDKREMAKNIYSEAFKDEFPPEYRGRIKDLVLFEKLNKEALEIITGLQLKRIEKEFAANGIKIELDCSTKTKDWIIEQGFNPSEGARALKKMMDENISEKLKLAHTSIGIHRKKIYLDLEENGSGVAFYYEEEQLSDFTPEEKIVLVENGSKNSRKTATPIEDQPKIKPAVAQEPAEREIAQPDETKPQLPEKAPLPTVPEKIKKILVDKFTEHGFDVFIEQRNNLVEAGFVSKESANNIPRIQAIAKKKLDESLSEYGIDRFIELRDSYISEGLGTIDEWNQLLD